MCKNIWKFKKFKSINISNLNTLLWKLRQNDSQFDQIVKNKNLTQERPQLHTALVSGPSLPRCQWCFTHHLGSFSSTSWIFHKGKTDGKFFQSWRYFSEGILVCIFVASQLQENIQASEMQRELRTGWVRISFLMWTLALSTNTETSNHDTINIGGEELKSGAWAWQFCPRLAEKEGRRTASRFVHQSHIQGMARSSRLWVSIWASLSVSCPAEGLHTKALSWRAAVSVWKWASCSFPKLNR